jgi:hypothetical protein
MAVFKSNFVAGILVGLGVALAAPLAGTELVASLSAPAKANVQNPASVTPQTVNRAGKADRIRPAHNAIGRSGPTKIPEGCDPAFSPLSKGAASNFSSRCLA